MKNIDFNKLDQVYQNYGYEPENRAGCRVYKIKYMRFFSVEIYPLSDKAEVVKVQIEYSKRGYATAIKEVKPIEDIENELFRDLFRHDLILDNLKVKYHDFVSKQEESLPEGCRYEYINSPYSYAKFAEDGGLISISERSGEEKTIVEQVEDIIKNHKGYANLIIIEAAAGFGKTSTVFELIQYFQNDVSNKLPFFIEVSRNREARIFMHILQNEIDKQFKNSITSDHAIHEIKKGRIPLIIDGFDELISKDVEVLTEREKNNIDGILNTILDLLSENANIIITSRSTAIFSDEQLIYWINNSINKFQTYRVNIKKPEITRWIGHEKKKLFENYNFEIENIANPVLLTYIRTTLLGTLRQTMDKKNSLVDMYFSYLFNREIIRQNIPFSEEDQFQILTSIAKEMYTLNFKAEEKTFIKEIIIEYNRDLIEIGIRKKQGGIAINDDELVDTLSNHALLDRKENGRIGFINEFVLGILVARCLVNKDINLKSDCNVDFLVLALESYKAQNKAEKEKLASILDDSNINLTSEFVFHMNHLLQNQIIGDFHNLEIRGSYFKKTSFNDCTLEYFVFDKCIFVEVDFKSMPFNNSVFTDCSFSNCSVTLSSEINKPRCFFYKCEDDNGFINDYDNQAYQATDEVTVDSNSTKDDVLMQFRIETTENRIITKKFIRINNLRDSLNHLNERLVMKAIKDLENENSIITDGNLCFLTPAGVKKLQNI